MTSVNATLKQIVDEDEAGSDSDKSLSTNEHSFPTTSGCSSGLNSASNGACSPPSMISRSKGVTANGSRCSYEKSNEVFDDISGVTTVATTMVTYPQTASPSLYKQMPSKR